MSRVTIGPRREGLVPGWWCSVTVGETSYDVGVLVIPGTGARPDTWGVVRVTGGAIVWQDRVLASIGPRDLLRLANLDSETA